MKATMKGYHSKSYIQKHTYCDYYNHIKLIWHLGKGCIQILKAYGPIFEPVSLHIDIWKWRRIKNIFDIILYMYIYDKLRKKIDPKLEQSDH